MLKSKFLTQAWERLPAIHAKRTRDAIPAIKLTSVTVSINAIGLGTVSSSGSRLPVTGFESFTLCAPCTLRSGHRVFSAMLDCLVEDKLPAFRRTGGCCRGMTPLAL